MNEVKKSNSINILCVIVMIISVIGILLILKVIDYSINNIIGLCFCGISLLGSMITLIKKSKLGILSALLTVVLIAVWVLNYIPNIKAEEEGITESQKTLFTEKAISFINSIYMDEKLYNRISCNDQEDKTTKIYLSETANEDKKSPLGNEYNIRSYVLIESILEDDKCHYKKYVYLTDGKYSLGSETKPISEEELYSKPDLISNN